MCQMCMTDAGTTQDNFILPAPPVGGLPISQDWLDRMKRLYDNEHVKYRLDSPAVPGFVSGVYPWLRQTSF